MWRQLASVATQWTYPEARRVNGAVRVEDASTLWVLTIAWVVACHRQVLATIFKRRIKHTGGNDYFGGLGLCGREGVPGKTDAVDVLSFLEIHGNKGVGNASKKRQKTECGCGS